MVGPFFWHTFEETTSTFFTGPPPPSRPQPNPQTRQTHTRCYASSSRPHPYSRPNQSYPGIPTYITPGDASQMIASLCSELDATKADLARAKVLKSAQVSSLETALAKAKYELHVEKEEATKSKESKVAFAAEHNASDYQKLVRKEKQLGRQALYKAIVEAVENIAEGEARVTVLEVVYALMEEDNEV